MFESREELMQWVQSTAFSLDYIIVTRRSKAKENGVVSYVTFICDRGGEYKFKESSKKSGTKKTNCKFRLVGSYLKQYDGWTLRVICDQHNHPPAQHMEGHAYARRLKENEKKLLVDLTSKNVTPHDILSTLKEQDENNNVGKTPIQVLMLLLNDKQFFTEFSVNNISNELENLFFIHPRSLDIWRAFSHVLIVDAMYKTNKYDLPFVQIVDVTSTNKTFSIAFAFIINEKEENYNWALTCLKLTLEGCMYLRVIVTDKELALMNACQQVFPDATRLLCRWHITENIKKHYRQSIKSQHERDSIRAMWTVLVESPTWIFKYKEMFVLVWIDRHLNFGEQTTNRVESQHAKLKKYICAKNSSLDKFVGCIDQNVKSQLTSIYESFEKSRIVLKHRHNLQCFRLFRGFVALEALDILEGELQWSSRHQLDYSNCGCKLRHSCGVPCACMLSVYLNSGECIPLDSIDVFWRKLDLSPSTSVENEDICCDSELEMFKENFTKQSKAGKKSLLRKLRDIFQLKLNKEPAKHSSYIIEILDLNQEPSEQVSDFIDLNQMPKSCDTHPLMKEILDMFHPYITHVQDVKGDGNCRFQAISVCLGYGEDQWLYVRHQLLDELLSSYDVYARVFTDGIDELRNSLCFSQSPAPAEHWMVMPITGVLIANRFGVILNYLTKRGDITFFPLWREGDYPMPTISACWIRHRAPSTAGWQTMYMSRLEFYRQLKPCNLKTPVITIENYC
uniref:MULE transposase domain-containing protein n=1 Tax=Gossypium raimondii TaxID=29730 RepID=A0A0D2QLW8_GOSRA|nr:hypothetical protein B456_007G053200 [Gossypium raimondii]